MSFPYRVITRTAEYNRVFSLPKRDLDLNNEALAQTLTEQLRSQSGSMSLRPVQAQALWELAQRRGLFAPIRVGGGKTLISLLAPVLLQAKRPLLLLPAKLIEKTQREQKALAVHWRLSDIKLLSYELLSHERGDQEFKDYAPDLIIADECHKLKNTKAACTRRVGRYLSKNPNTALLAMSGSITKRSIRDFWHIAKWCLKENTPMPIPWPEMSDWADALDEKVRPGFRVQPGPLGRNLSEARQNFQRRLIQTPGVISTTQGLDQVGLKFRTLSYRWSEDLYKAFTVLRTLWETPNGWPITDAISCWRHARELACGFFYCWLKQPPLHWLNARKEWASFVRQTIYNRRLNLDTELQVAKACVQGRLDDRAFWDWQEIRKTFEPLTEAVWLDNSALTLCAEWLEQNQGIAWVEHTAFGARLAKLTGLSFFGAGGLDVSGKRIEDASGSIIASIQANAEGRNLQRWFKNLVVSCPPSGAIWEQLIGRTHREGQLASQVEFDVLLACDEQKEGFEQAKADARYLEDTTGQPQKLLQGERR